MHWYIHAPDPDLVARLQRDFRCSPIIATILANRGIISLEESRPFFHPTLDQLHDPFQMRDMDRAVERIRRNLKHQVPILVFGDYDVDGTTGAALLYLALRMLGGRVFTYIPDREKEGYGFSPSGADFARQLGADLIITCDCGINAFAPVDYANSLGIDVIITDHHTPEADLPAAAAILNPKRPDCSYPFKGLCGGGVAYKLITALWEAQPPGERVADRETLRDLLDLVTLGTAADIVPILDENRVFVHQGLELLQTSSRPGLQALLEAAGLTGKTLSVGQLVFGLAPRINAAGRLGSASRAVELLTTDHPARARELALELDRENRRRQAIQQEVVEEALRLINAQVDLEQEYAIVLAGYDWHPGVVGIVASRIREMFNRPAVIIAMDETGQGKGSARSIPGLDMYEVLSQVSEHLEGFGGHPMAAGLTLREDRLEEFRRAFVAQVNERLGPADLEPTLTLDGEMTLTEIDGRLMDFLERLGPFGPGNMRPKFVARRVEIVGNPRVIGGGEHLRFKARQGRRVYPAVGFNQSQHYEKLIKGFPVDLAFVVEINEWQGQSTIQLNIRDIKLSE
jgi:single-stranded-DNA-specific exonuclease